MLLAELESFLSRPIAPTRRIALGRLNLPVGPAPGFGGILLGGIAARFGPGLSEDFNDEVMHLMGVLEAGGRTAQPRLRHRLQSDRVGLQRCQHRLIGHGERLSFHFDSEKGTAAQHVLCAVYAVGVADAALRRPLMDTVRKGFRWRGDVDAALVAHLTGHQRATSVASMVDPISWALEQLDLRVVTDAGAASAPTQSQVRRAYRDRLRAVHPDHGGADAGAAERIAELSEARRILLG